MKKLLFYLSLVLMVQVGFVYSLPNPAPFTSWKDLIARSQQIIIVKSIKVVNPEVISFAAAADSEVQVDYVLKGITNRVSTNLPHLGKATLRSVFLPHDNEYYLVFSSQFEHERYQAIETYRFVPIGLGFSTNLVAGKTIDDQIRAILKHRLEQLDSQANLTPAEQDEKKRLQSGLDQ